MRPSHIARMWLIVHDTSPCSCGCIRPTTYKARVTVVPRYHAELRLSRDGQRFLMIKPSQETSSSSLTQIVVVHNWFDELKRRVPPGKMNLR